MLAVTDAIVLRSRKQGDTSKIVSLYTREYGLVDVIAKGARQMKSKFGAALEPFTESKIVFYKKEHSELYLLSNAEVNIAHRNLTSDLDHIEAATHIAELLIRSQHHEESEHRLFELVSKTLTLMDAATPEAVWAILFSFYLRYVSMAGFAVTLEVDREHAKNLFFDAERGEILDLADRDDPHSERFIPLNNEMLSAMSYLKSHPLEASSSLRLSAESRYSLEVLFRLYFGYHLEGMQRNRTKAEKVFRQINARKR
ncbi:MAG TPA: DNA repair protein RecO [Candidatus Kapabacteria bacterium]|nr:DNA repair protein RecO [Candidatus Kapabacteria bacterium]